MKKFLKSITLVEWLIWSISVISIIVFFFVFKNTQYLYLIGSLIGATALIFVSKGNPIGQFLTIVFSIFYGIISYSFNYYGEMITYLAMTTPIAIWALISWLRNPYQENKSEVKVNTLSRKEWCLFLIAALIITVSFFFILQALDTTNLIISTLSVLTSFIAAYLTARRSRFYAIGYGVNDIVLIVMWGMASYENITYLPMVICFIAFFVADTYGFINWSIMNKKQKAGEKIVRKMRRFNQ
ncbi:MAG: nicotinamide riboside transporter PnuC [Clostridiales bacterium]|nr:nicotinamide riboside transporter PnuC [Clostridiales bacterium]